MKTIPVGESLALVDDEDAPFLGQFRWHLSGGYPSARIGGAWRAMHRVLVRYIPGREEIDHIDGNRLNNQKANLRIATKAQNGWNRGATKRSTTGLKGVYRCRQTGRYAARIMANGKSYHLGRFPTPELASKAYCAAADRLHGPYACAARLAHAKGLPFPTTRTT